MIRRCLLVALSLVFAGSLNAVELSKDSRALVDQLMELTGVNNIANVLAMDLTRQMVIALSQKYGPVNPDVAKAILAEANAIMDEELIANAKLKEIYYRLCAENFSPEQLKELLKFYRSPTGQQALKAMPIIGRQSLDEAKVHAKTLGPKIQSRMAERIDKLSLELELKAQMQPDSGVPSTEPAGGKP